MGHDIRELATFPERRRNFIDAWHRIDAYVRAHYIEAQRVEDETIWRRR
jgi:hypothetical protein